MPALHIGRSRVETVSASDGSTVPPGAVAAQANEVGIVSIAVDAATNNVTVTGVGPGSCGVTFSAAGYQSTVVGFQVSPPPSIVVTDGPEQ